MSCSVFVRAHAGAAYPAAQSLTLSFGFRVAFRDASRASARYGESTRYRNVVSENVIKFLMASYYHAYYVVFRLPSRYYVTNKSVSAHVNPTAVSATCTSAGAAWGAAREPFAAESFRCAKAAAFRAGSKGA